MPNDLPVHYATWPPRKDARSNLIQPISTYTPPAVSSSVSSPGRTKRQISADFMVTDRPSKRLGVSQHPSLVIDFESDEEDEVVEKQPDMAITQNGNGSIRDGFDGAAQLKKVEMEIAMAMAVIKKTQDLQEARRLKHGRVASGAVSPTNDSVVNILAPTQEDSSSKHTSSQTTVDESVPATKSLQVERARQEERLNELRSQATENDKKIAALREGLITSRLNSAEYVKQKTIENIREQNCVEIIEAAKDEITRLQSELSEQERILKGIRDVQATVAQTIAESARKEESLTVQIQSLEHVKKNFQPQIAQIKESLSKIRISELHLESTSSLIQPAMVHENQNSVNSITVVEARENSSKGSSPPIAAASTAPSVSSQSNPLGAFPMKFSELAHKTPSAPKAQRKAVDKLPRTLTTNRPPDFEERTTNDQKPAPEPTTLPKSASKKRRDANQSHVKPTVDRNETQPAVIAPGLMPNFTENVSGKLASAPLSIAPSVMALPIQQAVTAPLTSANGTFLEGSVPANATSRYSSPLSKFRAFKYHLLYAETVPSGFRSSTYFHKAGQDQMICSLETQTGSCQVAACSNQHFRDILMVSWLCSSQVIDALIRADRFIPRDI